MAVSPGTIFSHYKILSRIGAGGMGEVFLAEDLSLNRQVALKVLPENIASQKDRLYRFEREAQAVSALNHPNILTIFEFGVENGLHFLASEFVKGETLREKICRDRLTLTETLDISIQIVSALQAAHVAGVVHRDIKPENVMVREDGFVKVLDFGLAKLVGKTFSDSEADTKKQFQTQAGMVMGTAGYMSPEQARGTAIDARTDIFSLGVVIYEMLTRRQPFTGETINHIIVAILEKQPPPLSVFINDYPGEIEAIIGKALSKRPDDRFQTAKHLLSKLKELQKRLEFEAEFQRFQRSNEKTEIQTQIFEGGIVEEAQKLPPNNLSENFLPIIGRESEIAEINNLLLKKEVQLVTMTGVGGTGKTTLARAIARQLLPEFADGIFFVELAAITNPELVIPSIAQPLDVKEAGGTPLLKILKDFLRDKQMLLVIDNFEQVADAAPQISELLSTAPELKFLITSRTLLHLSAEHEYVVLPLTVPTDFSDISFDEVSDYESVKLFTERARNAKASFKLTRENAPSVAEICARLDGLPLAIELAAARVKILSPQQILTKLENCLKILTGGARDLPARQQTMRDAVEWSYELLHEDEKTLFRRLAVFAGGFTFEAAETVCAALAPDEEQIELLDQLTSLIDNSLLAAKDQPHGETRFRMLEVVREYAVERLETSSEAEAMRRGHAQYVLSLIEDAEPHQQGANSAEWLKILAAEHDNLRAALRWSLEQEPTTAARLAVAAKRFWYLQANLTQGREWMEVALKGAGLDIADDIRFKLLGGLGEFAQFQGDLAAAYDFYNEILKLAEATNNLRQIAIANRGLGAIAHQQGDLAAARKFMEEGLTISRELKDDLITSLLLAWLGDIERSQGDYQAARPLYEESLEISRKIDTVVIVISQLNNLGAVDFIEESYETARSHFADALKLSMDFGHKIQISYSLDGFAALAAERGDNERALRLAGAAESLRESIGFEIEPAERRFRDAYIEKLKGEMDEIDFVKIFEQGRKLKPEEAAGLI